MPIKNISVKDGLATKVCAHCKKEVQLKLDGLQLGRVVGDGVYPDDILFGECSCGAFEVLRRTWDTVEKQAKGTFFDRHRRVVNGLGEYLKKRGLHPKELREHYKEEKVPPDTDDLGELTKS